MRPHGNRGAMVGPLVVVLMMMVYCGICLWKRAPDVGPDGRVETVATVIENIPTNKGGSWVTVEYVTLDGRRTNALCVSCDSALTVGESVHIRYDPHAQFDEVDRIDPPAFDGGQILGWCALAVLSVIAGFLVFRIVRSRRSDGS